MEAVSSMPNVSKMMEVIESLQVEHLQAEFKHNVILDYLQGSKIRITNGIKNKV